MYDLAYTKILRILYSSIPTLFVAWIAARIRSAKLIIDWHNFAYTILGMSLGKSHFLVRLSYCYEKFFGRLVR